MSRVPAFLKYWHVVLAGGLVVLGAVSCTSVREVANLRKVDFVIEEVTQARLAGVDLDEVRSSGELTTQQVLRLGGALSNGTLPLSFTLHLQGTNPSSNGMNARLTQMDWTLLLEDKETVSGTFNEEVVLPPGEPTPIRFDIELDLVRFFDDNLSGLVDVASALSGEGPPQTVALQVRPTVRTRLGSFKYPSPITIVSEEVGRPNEP